MGFGQFGFQHFAEAKIMVSVVDCVAAQVMSLGFSADFMWLNKLKTSEKARVFHTLMAYLWDAKILLFLCKKSLRMPFFSSQNALFNGKTVAIRVKICIVSSGLHKWDRILFEETFLLCTCNECSFRKEFFIHYVLLGLSSILSVCFSKVPSPIQYSRPDGTFSNHYLVLKWNHFLLWAKTDAASENGHNVWAIPKLT